MHCIGCGSSEIAIDDYLQKNFDLNVCEKCKGANEDDKFSLITKTEAKKTYLIHMTHDLEYESLKKELPDHIDVGYDGLKITIN